MSYVKELIPKIILSLSIIITLGSYFFYYQPVDAFVTLLFGYAVVIAAFSLPIGAINLIQRNINSIIKRQKDWYLNVWLLICATIMTVLGVFFGAKDTNYNWIYQNVYQPISSTLTALPAFFVVSAAYRSFRARNVEAMLLLLSAVAIMLYNAPIGPALFPPIGNLGVWLSNYPQTTGNRVIFISWALGLVALSARYIFGKEGITGGES